jgi:hypothetical protein
VLRVAAFIFLVTAPLRSNSFTQSDGRHSAASAGDDRARPTGRWRTEFPGDGQHLMKYLTTRTASGIKLPDYLPAGTTS